MNRLDADQVNAPLGREGPRARRYFAQLRRKLLWQLLVAYVTPLLLLAAFFHYSFSETTRRGVENHLRSIAENQRNTVDLFLQDRAANVKSAFSWDAPPGEDSPADMQRLLGELKRESQTFVDVGLFDPSGTLIAYAGPHSSLLGTDYSQEGWFKAVRATERSHIVSDVFLGFRGKPHFIIAVPRQMGGRTWVMRASVDPEAFGALVAQSRLMTGVEAYIVNAQGEPQTFTETTQAQDRVSLPSRTAEASVQEIEVRGEVCVAAVAWLHENDWALVVRTPRKIAYASMRRARMVLVLMMVGALVLIVAIGVRGTRRLVSRLEEADRAREELKGQLFNAAKLASVGEMAAGVAHEINNPLAIIYEEAGVLRDSLNPAYGRELTREELVDRLDAITSASMRGRTITRKLLAFARQHDPNPELLDVNELVEHVLAMKDTEFSVTNIGVERDYGQGLPPIHASRNQLEQVLLNLLNNARDALGGPGKVQVRTSADDRFVRIDVEDSGCGMTAEQMEKVFFPFYTTKAVGKGTGLGLSISYGIVKTHGGRIEVSSELDVGTTFTVVLPSARREGTGGVHAPGKD